MKKEKPVQPSLTASEIELLEQLRAHPELKQRFEAILNITCDENGPIKTADEVEGLVVDEVRRLGHTTMSQWAAKSEVRAGKALKAKVPSVYKNKKKS